MKLEDTKNSTQTYSARNAPRRTSHTWKRCAYWLFRSLCSVCTWWLWDFRIQRKGKSICGEKLYVSNHLTSLDPYWLVAALPEYLHFVAGPPFHLPVIRSLFTIMEQINALPQNRKSVVPSAAELLTRGETVCLFPEGDIQPPFALGHFYPGLARIYRMSHAPIVPVVLAVDPLAIRHYPRWDICIEGRNYETRIAWRGKVRLKIGEPFWPEIDPRLSEEEQDRTITAQVRTTMERMLDELGRESFASARRPHQAVETA